MKPAFNVISHLWSIRPVTLLSLCFALTGTTGCGTGKAEKKKDEFFTPGSRQADQRASQTMAKQEQLAGSGEGSGEKDVKKAKAGAEGVQGAQAERKLTLYERLGGTEKITAIVDDFTTRAIEDPRVNWERKGSKSSGFSLHRNKDTAAWNATPENVTTLKKHLVQFLALATGGPAQYDGKPIKGGHSGMRISNPEFDAVIGDFKASLDKHQIPNKEQKELLAIVESTRPEIVTQR